MRFNPFCGSVADLQQPPNEMANNVLKKTRPPNECKTNKPEQGLISFSV